MPTKKGPYDCEIAKRFMAGENAIRFSSAALDGLPGEAWKWLCVVAWIRLERSNPRWSEMILDEFWAFQTTWRSQAFISRYKKIGGNVDEAWLRDVVQLMLMTEPRKGQKPLGRPRYLLRFYNQFLRDVSEIKKGNPRLGSKPAHAQRVFWKEKLQGLFDQHPFHDETRTHAQMTPALIEIACSAPPSDVALAMLQCLYKTSPSRLKKIIFPKLRSTPLSPLELWQGKLFKSDPK